MVFSYDDRILIKQLHHCKGWVAKKLVNEFMSKRWNVRSVRRLLKKLKDTGTTDRKAGSGRPHTVKSEENVAVVQWF